MKKKLNLNNLHVKSFITARPEEIKAGIAKRTYETKCPPRCYQT